MLPTIIFLSLALSNIFSKEEYPDPREPAGLSNYTEAENKEKTTSGNSI